MGQCHEKSEYPAMKESEDGFLKRQAALKGQWHENS
jgi:hypothetical protein